MCLKKFLLKKGLLLLLAALLNCIIETLEKIEYFSSNILGCLVADYWVSQTRKYCEFCKCWITDNKPSVDFHEKGRRHQENVKKKLRNITKHSSQTQKHADKVDVAIKQMESAALEAYRKDIEVNGDLTSMLMKEKLPDGKSVRKLWNEAKTREGKSYYVNIMTKETVWRPPPEGYLSIAEQRAQADSEAEKQFKALQNYKKKEAIMTMQKVQQEEMEESSRRAREKLKERRVVDDIPVTTCGPLLEPGKTDPYGKWQTVKERPVVDLQLPEQEYYEIAPIQYEPEPVVKEFKEKTIVSLEGSSANTESGISFKKRKLNSGAKFNSRQRLDD